MWKVYILYSTLFKKSYVGCSSDTVARLERHNKGRVKSTRKFRPWKIIYEEALNSYSEARKREKYFKNSAGRRKMKTIFIELGISN